MRSVLPSLLIAAALTASASAPALSAAVKRPPAKKHVVHRVARKIPAPSIALPIDEVRVVPFSQPVSTVYVGHPVVADVRVIASRHARVLGKGFGSTNIIALNSHGKQV